MVRSVYFKAFTVFLVISTFLYDKIICDNYTKCPEKIIDPTIIERITCEKPDNIKIINLDNKNITQLNYDTFSQLTSLISLSLNNNRIGKITKNLFKNMINLKHLCLRYNQIEIVSRETFGEMKKLKKLLLDNNNVRYVFEGAFENCASLIMLRLDRNCIELINETAFPIQNSMKILDVSRNSLKGLDFLKTLVNIEDLNISSNKLEFLKSNAFENLSNLEYLDLSYNLLESLPVNVFHNLTKLKSLYISHNRISAINTGTFELNLNILMLNDNKISFIGQALNNISEVHLERNILTTLNLPRNNITLHIDDNVWDCEFIDQILDNSKVKLLYTKIVNITNRNGIPCHDKINTSRSMLSIPHEKEVHNYSNMQYILFIACGFNVMCILIVLIICTCYKKRKKSPSFTQFYTTPSPINSNCYNNFELSHQYLTPISHTENIYEEIDF